LSPDTVDYLHRTGAPPGFKPWHIPVGVAIFVVWFGVLGFVLTHGRNQGSSVDVYSEVPPGLTTSLAAQGVTYQGLSPVDSSTTHQVLSRLPAIGNDNGGQPLVFRTTFAVRHGKPSAQTPALMVVVPDPTGSDVHVDFVDPTTYRTLLTVSYNGTGSPSSSPTG
jgi:hypothetical protein